MRFYSIALFTMCVYVMGGLLAASSPQFHLETGAINQSKMSAADAGNYTKTIQDIQTNSTMGQVDPLSGALGWFYQQLVTAANKMFDAAASPVIKYVMWLPFYLMEIGFPPEYAGAIFTMLTAVMVVGFIQFFKGQEVER